jgi:hypothetical protein
MLIKLWNKIKVVNLIDKELNNRRSVKRTKCKRLLILLVIIIFVLILLEKGY